MEFFCILTQSYERWERRGSFYVLILSEARVPRRSINVEELLPDHLMVDYSRHYQMSYYVENGVKKIEFLIPIKNWIPKGHRNDSKEMLLQN